MKTAHLELVLLKSNKSLERLAVSADITKEWRSWKEKLKASLTFSSSVGENYGVVKNKCP